MLDCECHLYVGNIMQTLFVVYIYCTYSGVPWVNALGGGGGAPSGKVCVVTSVASFLVWGGGEGGGARPPNVPTKNIHIASASETYIFRTQNTSAYIIQSMHFPLLMVYGAINDIILTKH